MKHPVRLFECERDFGWSAGGIRGVRHAPMGRHRLSRPHRAGLSCRVVADRKHEIERRRTWLCKLVPRLRAKARYVVAQALQQLDGMRVDLAFGLAAGAERPQSSLPELAEDGLGHDRAGRIA